MTDHSSGLDLLVFRERGHRFGLDAAQVEEMLRLQELELQRDRSDRIRSFYRDGVEIPVVEMTAVIGMERATEDEYSKLVLVNVKQSTWGFLISEPEEIVPVEVEDIELLPALIRRMVKGSGIWGVVKGEGEMVVLVDLMEAIGKVVTQGKSGEGTRDGDITAH